MHTLLKTIFNYLRRCFCDVMVKAIDCGIVVAPLRSLSDNYSWKKHEPPYPPIYGLNKYHNCPSKRMVWY